MAENHSGKTKILVIRASAFGDVVLTLGPVKKLLQAISKFSSDVEVHFLVKEKYSDLLTLLDGEQIKTIVLKDKGSFFDTLKLACGLRHENYSVVVDLHNNLRSRLITPIIGSYVLRLSKFRLRELSAYLCRSFFGKAKKNFYRSHAIEELLFGAVPKEFVPFLKNGIQKRVRSDLPEKYVAICADSAWSSKRWSVDNFIAVSKELLKNTAVVWVGLDGSFTLEEGINCTKDFRKKLPLDEMVQILHSADLFICNDSGLMHLSEESNTPVVAVFGPTDARLGFAPRHAQSTIVESSLWCRPCSKNGVLCHRIQNKRLCFKLVSVESVVREARLRLM